MAEDLDDIVDNLQEPSAWIRIVFMIGYALLLYVVIVPVMFVIGLVQALFVIITGDDNEKLRGLGGALAEFVHQLLSFFTYNTEDKPFPFKDFPEFTYGADPVDEQQASPRSGKPASKKSAARKSAKKKTSARKKMAASKKTKAESTSEDGDGKEGAQSASD